MKKLKSVVVILAAFTFTFTSCENENFENETVVSESRQPLSQRAFENFEGKSIADGPQSIEELREHGISVSNGLASFLRNDFDLLIFASDLAIHNPNRLRSANFFESEITELVQINLGYNTLIGFSPALPGLPNGNGGIPRINDFSDLIGQWNVDGFKTGAISAFGAKYELVNDLSNININAAPSATANGFEITATEFRYTNNGTVVDTFPIAIVGNGRSSISVIENGQTVNVTNIPLITADGNTLTFTYFYRNDDGRRRIASYRLTRE